MIIQTVAKTLLLLVGIYLSINVVVWFRKRWDRPSRRDEGE